MLRKSKKQIKGNKIITPQMIMMNIVKARAEVSSGVTKIYIDSSV